MEKGLNNCSDCENYICDKLKERLVIYKEIKDRLNHVIPEDDYTCFIRPYENKKRLQEIISSRRRD